MNSRICPKCRIPNGMVKETDENNLPYIKCVYCGLTIELPIDKRKKSW